MAMVAPALFRGSPISIEALLASTLVAALYYIIKKWLQKPRAGGPPRRPSWLPWGVDRLWLAMRAHRKNQGLGLWSSMFRDWANPRRPLTFESKLGRQNVIFTVDPKNLKAVLASQFDAFGKGGRFDHLRPFLGDSIFINDGEKWSSARQMLRFHLSEDRISDMRILDKNADSVISYIERQKDESGYVTDVESMFLCYTMDMITEFLLGISPHSLNNPHDKFSAAFHDIQVYSGQIARAGPLSFLIPQRRYRDALKVLDEYIEPYVRHAVCQHSDGFQLEPTEIGDSFLLTLAGTEKDPKFLRDSIVTVLFAGRDSTASTLTWLLYELSRDPVLWQQARSEVISVMGKGGKPTFKNLKRLTFVQACINETLRLYPLVPFNIREALTDTTLPHGGGWSGCDPIFVPKGTAVSFSPLFLQRSVGTYEEVLTRDPAWPDPLKFDPSRWSKWAPKSWTYLPFNGGPRLCLGQRFALTEMVHIVSVLLQRYESVENVERENTPGLMCNLTVSPSTKIQIRFQ